MNANDTFVVVDLETTGHSVKKGGRIIQIGMTFIKKRQIVDHFESFVNPGQLIDRQIQQLTHISQKDVQNAPYFEEIAPLLQNLLQNTVIIAHNVNFDYPYLNDEFERTGFPLLKSAAIDTVQLAQILFPMAPGYRLLDLTTYLNITLKNAHRANADAHATALLFLKFWKKLEELPDITLKQLQQGDWPLLRQTQQFLKLVHSKNKQNFGTVEQVAVLTTTTEQTIHSSKSVQVDYPETSDEKTKLFGQWLTTNVAQNSLMDRANQFLDKRTDGLLTILTGPRVGKTLAYLVPVILSGKTAVLLTNDESLQAQQVDIITNLTKLFSRPMQSAILYEPSEYINVEKFAQTLEEKNTLQIQFFKARVLVWLTQTKTGLLREISVGVQNGDYVSSIRGDSHAQFFEKAYKSAHQANIIIMNFSTYFVQSQKLREEKKIDKWPVVVMETPTQFVDDLHDYFHVSLNVTQYQNILKGLNHQEIAGLTHKQRLFVRQSLSEALKLLKQILQSDNQRANLKRVERFLLIILHLKELFEISENSIPHEFQDARDQLLKIRRLQLQNDIVVANEFSEVNGQTQTEVVFDILERAIYQAEFVSNVHKLLIVSEFLPTEVTEFLRDVPEPFTVEREFVHNDLQPIHVVQLQRSSPIVHLQAITQRNVGEILLIVPNEERVNHWYQKIKYAVTTNYNIVAEGITGSLEKIQRQSQTKRNNIIIVTPKIFSTMWHREQELPAIVIVPEREVWQPVSRLAYVLTQMQRYQNGILVSQLNAMQRNRFKQQIVVEKMNFKKGLEQQYDRLLHDL